MSIDFALAISLCRRITTETTTKQTNGELALPAEVSVAEETVQMITAGVLLDHAATVLVRTALGSSLQSRHVVVDRFVGGFWKADC